MSAHPDTNVFSLDAFRASDPSPKIAPKIGGNQKRDQKDFGNGNNEVSARRHSSNKEEKPHTKKEGKRSTVTPYEARVSMAQVRADCERMTATQLAAAYPGTNLSKNNMIYDRVKNEGAIVPDEFRSLKAVLLAVGPRRHQDLTLDRIDNNSPVYDAANVAWRDPKEQSGNRWNTLFLPHPETGDVITLTAFCELTDASADALRQRRTRGMEGAPVQRPANLIENPRHRIPWAVPREEGAGYLRLYRSNRILTPHGWEWPFETLIRLARQHEEDAHLECAALREGWGGEPTDEEAAAYEEPSRRLELWSERVRQAEDALPQWIADIGTTARPDAPKDKARTLEDHGRDFIRVPSRETYQRQRQARLERQAAKQAIEAPRRPPVALEAVARRYGVPSEPTDGGQPVKRIRPVARPAYAGPRTARVPAPSYGAADLVPDALEMHEDGFPMDDEAGRYFRRVAAAMKAADVK